MGDFEVKKIFFYIAFCILFFIIFDTTRSYVLFRKSRSLVEKSVPFERINENTELKILVLGDSTAVGTGVQQPFLSTAGRLSTLYPEAQVLNWAENGMRLKELVLLIEKIRTEEQFSLILVQIGANDIIRMTSLKSIEKDAAEIMSRLSRYSDKIIILHSGDIGSAPFFPRYLRPILTRRSLQVRDIYQKVSSIYGVTYVDLIESETDTLLNENPSKYYADDYLHLSDEGYGLWFDEIQKNLNRASL